jgi:hypothetical protein
MIAEIRSVWSIRAERLAEQVLAEIKGNLDALPSVSLLQAVLRIEAGELPESEMDGCRWDGEEEDESACTCPPDLRARGGFKSTCPVHG